MYNILAIETSCDETSMAVIKSDYEVCSLVTNTQIETFANYGGVIPELSSRLHEKNIFFVYEETLKKANMTIKDIDYIAVTFGPGLVGSLLCGINFAKTISLMHDIPVLPINHMQAHISAIHLEHEVSYPLVSLIISGGHTDLVYCKSKDNYELIGQTLDDAAGECLDKIARLIGLGYPGGPEIQAAAFRGKQSYNLPLPMNDDSYNFSFSGLKSAAYNLVNQAKMKNIEINKDDLAFSALDSVITIVLKKLERARIEFGAKQVAIVGGVSANKQLRSRAYEMFEDCLFPSLEYSTDNAAMIGACAITSEKDICNIMELDVNVRITVEDNWKSTIKNR